MINPPGPDVSLSLGISPASPPPEEAKERGAWLIRLLLSCVKHASFGNLNRADAYLCQISELASVSGDSMQRLSARFASALAVRLVKHWPGLYKAINITNMPALEELRLTEPVSIQRFPYLGVAYSIITLTLVPAMSRDHMVHIVDLGSGDPELWVALLRGFVKVPGVPPNLKLTCVSTNKPTLESLGHGLAMEADLLDLPFHFNPLNIHLRDLTLDMLKVGSDETLGIVSILGLHKLLAEDDRVDAHFGANKNSNGLRESKHMSEFLAQVRSMNPKVFFLVEQEADHNRTRLIDRFVEGLHYYSAVFDSLDENFGSLSSHQQERHCLEEMFGKEIENIVSCEGLERLERHEKHAKWAVRFTRAGFKPVHLWFDLSEENKMVDGKSRYRVVSESHCTMVCWHERPLYALSAWTC